MNLVVIGTGMYVSGRGTGGFGTILPSIVEWKRKGGALDKVILVGTNKNRAFDAADKFVALQTLTGIEIDFSVCPDEAQNDSDAYRKVYETIAEDVSSELKRTAMEM